MDSTPLYVMPAKKTTKDSTSDKPKRTLNPIIKAMNEGKNIIVTPHIGGMTIEGQTKAYKWSINKL